MEGVLTQKIGPLSQVSLADRQSILLTDLVENYVIARTSAGYSEHTIERVSLTMRMIVRDMNINKVEDLTTEALLEWGDKKRKGEFGRALSQSGLYAAYNSVRSFLIYLDDAGIEHSVNRKLIHCKPDYKERECLRPEEIKKILKFAPYNITVLIKLLYMGGMRISEGLALKVTDIRPDSTIHVNNSKWCESRKVLISDDLRVELMWLAKNEGYIFKDKGDPNKPLDRKIAYYYIKTAMVRAGYPKANPHSLRHGYATTLLREGADISHVRRMLGHKNITTTQIYEHLIIDDLRLTYNKFLVKI